MYFFPLNRKKLLNKITMEKYIKSRVPHVYVNEIGMETFPTK